jgi:anti-sigma B factor antagonist
MANLEQTDVDGVTVLRLKGTLDRIELSDVERTFHAATHRDHASVVIDLADVNFLTTPAIAMFLEAAKTLRHSGGRVVVTRPSPRVEDVLRRLRLDALMPVMRSVAEGIARVKNGDGDHPTNRDVRPPSPGAKPADPPGSTSGPSGALPAR